jgi:hypothetical protein
MSSVMIRITLGRGDMAEGCCCERLSAATSANRTHAPIDAPIGLDAVI